MSASPAPAALVLIKPKVLKGRPAIAPRATVRVPAREDHGQLRLELEGRLSVTASGPVASCLALLLSSLPSSEGGK